MVGQSSEPSCVRDSIMVNKALSTLAHAKGAQAGVERRGQALIAELLKGAVPGLPRVT